jgi:hypothetical protein
VARPEIARRGPLTTLVRTLAAERRRLPAFVHHREAALLEGGDAASPVDRGRAGSKHHLLVDATGIPLACTLTAGNRNDVTQLIPARRAGAACARQSEGRDAGRSESPPTVATTTTSTGANFASAGSARRSRAARRRTAPGSAAPAGSSSAPSPGCTTSSGCSSVTTAAPRSTRPSSPLATTSSSRRASSSGEGSSRASSVRSADCSASGSATSSQARSGRVGLVAHPVEAPGPLPAADTRVRLEQGFLQSATCPRRSHRSR